MSKSRILQVTAVLVAALSACSGDESTEEGGGGSNSGCASDSDCKGDRICVEGACVEETTEQCADAGESCDAEACCSGETCVAFGGDSGNLCSANCSTGTDCVSGCCAMTQAGQGVCAPQDYCGVGSLCETPENCLTDTCIGWCTDYCSNSNQCPGNSWCMLNNAGDQLCFIGCDSSADCAAYPGTSCQSYTTVDNFTVNVCAA
ncbi:MAG: hypothetical protein U0271_03050 [Polyangiaceae bacterium]